MGNLNGMDTTKTDNSSCISSEAANARLRRMADAIRADAVRMADTVCDFLETDENAAIAEKFVAAPPCDRLNQLLLIAGMLRLQAWERAHLIQHLPTALPTSASVREEMLRRESDAPSQAGYQLYLNIFRVWFWHFVWTTLSDIGVEVVFRVPELDSIINEIAESLWRFRHLAKKKGGLTHVAKPTDW